MINTNIQTQNQELVQISETEINGVKVQTVNARDLYKFLEVSTRFNDWISRRIKEYEFVENQDFICITQKRVTQTSSGRNGVSIEQNHYITIDMAKELSMVERNEQGRLARRYFIECEKRLKEIQEEEKRKLPETFAEALRMLANEVEENAKLKAELEETKPKATYHDLVLNCSDLMTITQISQDYPISNQRLDRILQEEGIQYKDKSGVWCVYAKHSSKGICQTSTHVYKDSKGVDHAKLHLKWTQKGRLFIYDLLKSKGILPNIELDDYVAPPEVNNNNKEV